MNIQIENKPIEKTEFNLILDTILDFKHDRNTYDIDLRDRLQDLSNMCGGFNWYKFGNGSSHLWVSDRNGNRIIFVEF